MVNLNKCCQWQIVEIGQCYFMACSFAFYRFQSGANLKKLLVCSAPTYPLKLALPKKNCHSEVIFFFKFIQVKSPMAGTTFLSSKTVFSMIHTMLYWLRFKIFFLYGQHFGPCTIYRKRSINIWPDLKKERKKVLPTYLFWNWWIGAQKTKNFLRMASGTVSFKNLCLNWHKLFVIQHNVYLLGTFSM